jgi:transcriptional regulator with XRE-family HTH domain
MDFGSVLKQLRIERGFSQAALAKALDIQRTTVSNYEAGTSSPNLDLFISIVKFFGVSSDYLLGLVGIAQENAQVNAQARPLIQDKTYILQESIPEGYSDQDRLQVSHRSQPIPTEIRVNPILVTVDQHGRENITLVESRAAAGYTSHYMEPEFVKNLPAFQIPRPEFRNATFRGFEVNGQSMAPTFQPGELAIASYVDNWPQNIKNGYVYVIVTPYAILIKRVLNRTLERGVLALQSDNEEYETQEISSLDVLEVWYVKASLRFRFPNVRFQATKRLGELEADVSYLLKEVQEIRLKTPREEEKGLKNVG